MKIKLDENLPAQLAIALRSLGHDVHILRDEQLTGHADDEIWDAAQKDSRFLITQDLDFSDVRKFAPGTHHGILLIRLHSPSRRNLIARITELFGSERTEDWTHCFVVVTDSKIRILRPESKSRG